jgi:hypothetical protein
VTLDRPREGPAHATDDELIDLVHGFLSAGQRETVVSHLLDCAPCDARFQLVVRDHEQGLAIASGMLERSHGATPILVRALGVGWRLPIRAAAVLLVVVGVGWLLVPHGAGRGPASRAHHEWLPAGTPWGNLREAADAGPDSTILAGVAAYERRDLRGAEVRLRDTRSEGAYELVRRLYLANTLVALGRSADALPVLTGRYWDLPEPWRGEWDWTFMVACAHAGQPARADSLLDVLRARGDSIGVRARALQRDARDRH